MAEDEIIKKHTQSVYNTWIDPNKKWFHKLKDILQEIIIIVFAVSVSIWFHNWSESHKDQQQEKAFLSGLKTDLQADLQEMKGDSGAYQIVLKGISYFRSVGAGEVLNTDSLKNYYWILFASVHKQSRTSRFEALKGSGKLDIIENKELLGNIISLYQEIYSNISLGNKTFSDYIENRIGPLIDTHAKLDTANNIVNWQDILRNSEFRMGIFRANTVAQNIQAYSLGINKCGEIIKQIDKELE
ncbi:MAG TPA: hypothetical protein VKI61_20025 [Chitinophagaceae bacterium]|nr:hypothetical protein [Chitinophagaceae bacterium]